jgi:hypothetical protein
MICCLKAASATPDRRRRRLIPQWLAALLLAVLAGCQSADTPVARYEMAAQGLFSAALSTDGRLSLIGSLNHGGSLWRNNGYERLFNWNHEAGEFTELAAVGFSHDGNRAVTASPRSVVVWDTISGQAMAYWGTPGEVMSVALTAGGEHILLGLADHSGLVVDASDGAHRRTLLHEGPVSQIRLSADNRWILTGSDDATAVLWRREDGAAVTRLSLDNPVRQVAVSANGRFLFAASHHGEVGVWEGATGTPLKTLYDRNPGVTSAAFSSDESHLLLGFVNARVELWDVVRGERRKTWHADGRQRLRRGGNAILALAFAGTAGPYLALGSDGYLLELR